MLFDAQNVYRERKPLTLNPYVDINHYNSYLRWSLTGKLSSTPTFFQGLCNSVINGKAAAENVEKSGEKKT